MSIGRTQQSQVRDLEESLATLSVLEENLKKTDSITQKMSTLLSTVFDARLGKLEESIKPMYNTTRNLTQMSQNIDSAIAAMDNMRKNFDTIPREEAIIRAGPKQNISEYFGSITRLQSSLNTLSRSNMRAADSVQQMSQLVKLGMKQLDDVFRRTLTTNSQVIDPMEFLIQDRPFPTIPAQPLQLLSTLINFFVSIPGLESQYENIYADVRGGYISSSLSDTSAATLSTAQGRQGQSVTPGVIVRACLAFLEAEMETINNMMQVRQIEIFTSTSLVPIGQFSRTFKALNTQIRTSPSQNLPLALSVLDDVTTSQELISRSRITQDTLDAIRREVNTLEREARSVGTTGVNDVLEDIKRKGQNIITLPSDGGVIDLTTDTMAKLTNLMAFSKPLAQLLMSLPTSGSQSSTTLPPLNLDTDSHAILARWAMDVIDSLTNILETKSKNILRPRSAMAANLFMLNNLSEIEKRVRKNTILQSVVGSIGNVEKEKDAAKRISRASSSGGTILFSMPKSFEKLKRAGLDGYLDGYKDVAGYLLDVTYIKGASNRSSGSLSGKEREAVKERFRNFNTEFEELIRVNRSLSVPDPDVRGLVIGEIRRVVIPLYTRFYDKHSNSEFTKNTGKYIKWDKTQLDSIISRFFEGGSPVRTQI